MTSLATLTHKTMPRKINYPSYQTGGPTDDPERLYKMYLSALEDIDRKISNYGTINMDDVYDFPSSSGAASAIDREAGLERLFDQKRDLEGSLRRQGKLQAGGSTQDRNRRVLLLRNRRTLKDLELHGDFRRNLDRIPDDIYQDIIMGRADLEDYLPLALAPGETRGFGAQTRSSRLLARPERGLLPDFSQDPEYGRLRDKMGIKPTSAVMRRGFKGTGLKGLLMAGGATLASPIAALADVLMSPEGLGSGDLPEHARRFEDPSSDENRMRYYDELLGQSDELLGQSWDNRLGGGERRAREQYEARQENDSIPNFDADQDRTRYYEELMRQGDDLMPSYDYFSDEEPEDEESLLQRLLGGLKWDNRLGGEEEAERLYKLRQEMEESRAAEREYERQEREPELWRLMHEARERRRIPGRASGGIIGLQEGGPAPAMPAPAMTEVTSYGVPQQTANQWAGLTDRIVREGQRPYRQYGGQRIAGFTQPEAAAMAGQVAYGQGMGPMGTRQAAQTLGQAGQMIGGSQQGLMSLQPQYAQMAGRFGVAAPLAQRQAQTAAQGMGQLAGRAQLQGQLAGAGMRTAGRAGQVQQQLLGLEQAGAGQAAMTAQDKFASGSPAKVAEDGTILEEGTSGMTDMGALAQTKSVSGAEDVRGIGTKTASPKMQKEADLAKYMSQYTSNVTDPQLRGLLEFQKMQGQELGSQAAQAGAFGGLRQGVQAATQAQDVSQQAADIIGKSQQEAFQSAEAAFQADRAAQAAGYGQQLTAEQQASGQEQQGLQAQMAAQQQASRMAAQGAQFGMHGLEAQAAAERAGVGMSQLAQQQGFQAAQAGANLGLNALGAAQDVRQQGWDTYGQMLGQQQGAIGAQGQLYGQAGAMGSQLVGLGGQQMQLGGQQQQQQIERLRGMQAAGEKQRQMQQQSLGMGYQDWQNIQDQERANIGWQQAAMSGLPYKGTITGSRYTPQTGAAASALGTGIAGMTAWDQYNKGQQQNMPGSASESWQDWKPPSSYSWNNSGPLNPAGAGAGAGAGGGHPSAGVWGGS